MERIATGLGIALQFEYDEIKDKGWLGQPKGLLQVLWERGWIDKKQKVSKHYTINGSKDRFGSTIPNTSLTALMESCFDFINEKNYCKRISFNWGSHSIGAQNATQNWLVRELSIPGGSQRTIIAESL